MSNIVISGYYGFGNAGDEAMLCAIVDAIRKEEADAHITVISGNPRETSKKHDIHAVGTFSAPGIVKAIASSDLVISGGGSLLQDATSIRNTYYYLSIMGLAKLMGKKVMLYSQGIGPLNRKSTRRAVGCMLKFVDAITVRDSISKDELESLGIEDVEVTADAVLAMNKADISIGQHILDGYTSKLPDTGISLKRIGVAVRSWKEDTEYRESLANVLARLQGQDQVEIIFIPMSHPEDTKEAKLIAGLMPKGAIVLEGPFSTEQQLSLSGNVDLMIGIRLHALVFSSLMGKPVIGISYDPKITSFLHMIGQEPIGTMTHLREEALYRRCHELLTSKTVYQESYDRIRALRSDSQRNAEIAISLLKDF
ncbi:polysaccharide pyruvyl transferase CsaB [Veillonella denticariosi JCM 15641]|uniref:Polysaccharide pyruvyl transferase CsaB n=1 Tax=Veillonella denticariosi JCM 15641 TaxID=1298594 RepID=A0A2S7Z6X0_9FIRM|nr:polysaccharide pyruvyl transferase CsaB [Veillonella denticariosi]PQL19001.1 polysaccharide pyruvyl transferase CsaB [Veillonella denticariosi JCM 15641]